MLTRGALATAGLAVQNRRPVQKPSTTIAESLSGLIERVTFFHEENGYAVLRVKAKGHRDLVTVVGSLPSVSAGEWVTAQGQWVQDREFGLQFKAEMLNSTAPTTKEGIEKYLGSGMVKGIGPVYAKKLVATFGEGIFDIIETQSARLEDVDGIGPKRRKCIKDAWAEQKVIRKIMVFLHSNGVSTSRAVRIYKTYGEGAIERVQADPYCLAKDIHGIGFKTADQIAQKVGIPHDSILRACAGLNHVLLEATGDGHCALPVEMLRDAAGKLLLVDEKIVAQALERTLANGDLVQENIAGQELLFLPSLKRAEEVIAARIKKLCASPSNYPAIDADKAIEWCQGKTGKELAPSQREALKQALTSRVLVITGGPGVGTMPVTGLCRVAWVFLLSDRLSARHSPALMEGHFCGGEFALCLVNDSLINFTRKKWGARMRRPPQRTHRIVSSEIGRPGLHANNGLVSSAIVRKVRPLAATKKATLVATERRGCRSVPEAFTRTVSNGSLWLPIDLAAVAQTSARCGRGRAEEE